MEIIYHNHHIVPKHMNGTDDPSNMLRCNVALHAFLHKLLFEEHGHWQDRIAWRGLAGLIGHDEIMTEVHKAKGPKISAAKKGCIPWNKGKAGIYSKETLRKMSGRKSEKHRKSLMVKKSDSSKMGRYERTVEVKKKLSKASSIHWRVSCSRCRHETNVPNLARHAC